MLINKLNVTLLLFIEFTFAYPSSVNEVDSVSIDITSCDL